MAVPLRKKEHFYDCHYRLEEGDVKALMTLPLEEKELLLRLPLATTPYLYPSRGYSGFPIKSSIF